MFWNKKIGLERLEELENKIDDMAYELDYKIDKLEDKIGIIGDELEILNDKINLLLDNNFFICLRININKKEITLYDLFFLF